MDSEKRRNVVFEIEFTRPIGSRATTQKVGRDRIRDLALAVVVTSDRGFLAYKFYGKTFQKLSELLQHLASLGYPEEEILQAI
jgi:hypothetical protein